MPIAAQRQRRVDSTDRFRLRSRNDNPSLAPLPEQRAKLVAVAPTAVLPTRRAERRAIYRDVAALRRDLRVMAVELEHVRMERDLVLSDCSQLAEQVKGFAQLLAEARAMHTEELALAAQREQSAVTELQHARSMNAVLLQLLENKSQEMIALQEQFAEASRTRNNRLGRQSWYKRLWLRLFGHSVHQEIVVARSR